VIFISYVKILRFVSTGCVQAHSQVAMFGGAQYSFRGERFLLLLYL